MEVKEAVIFIGDNVYIVRSNGEFLDKDRKLLCKGGTYMINDEVKQYGKRVSIAKLVRDNFPELVTKKAKSRKYIYPTNK